jgi:hypothetical protein
MLKRCQFISDWKLIYGFILIYAVMNLLGTFQPRLVAIPSVIIYNGPELALHRHDIENKEKHA